jgi:hypothetical protein
MTADTPGPLEDSLFRHGGSRMTPRSNRRTDTRSCTRVPSRRRRGRRFLAFGAAILVGSLIGGAGGADAIGPLTGKHIRDDSLRSPDFHDNSIRAGRFHDGNLRQADVSFDLTGDQGPPGNPGPPGFPGVQALTYRTGATVSDNAAGAITVTAFCMSGEVPLSGGARLDAAPVGPASVLILDTGVTGNGGWSTRIAKSPGDFAQYTPFVVCARVR